MPTTASADPNATITMIGAEAAALITGIAPRPAERIAARTS